MTAPSWGTAATSAPTSPPSTSAWRPRASRSSSPPRALDDPAAATKEMLRTNRYDPSTGTLVWTDEQVKAYNDAVGHYTKMFGPMPTAMVLNRISSLIPSRSSK